MSQIFKRFYLHFLRYRTPFFVSVSFITVVTFVFAAVYPGEEPVSQFVSYLAFLATIEVENPGFYFWLLFVNALMLTLYPALISIFLGVNLLPFSEKDGKELLVTTSKSTIRFYLENVILLLVLMGLILLPGYILAVIMLYLNDAMATLTNLSIGYVLALAFSVVCGLLAGFGSSLKYSKTQGYLLAGGYIIISFLLDLGKSIEGFDFLTTFSLHNQARIVENSFTGTLNVDFLILSAVLSLAIIAMTLLTLYRKDFLEGGVRSSKIVSEETLSTGWASKLGVIKKPLDIIFSRLGWKYAAFRDQLHSLVGVITFFILFGSFIPAYAIIMFLQGGEDQTMELLEGFQFPIFDAAMYNHTFDAASDLFTYFLSYEMFAFAWMIFGPFILVGVYNLTNRDKKDGYAEFTWTLSRSSNRILLERTAALIFSFISIFLASFVVTYSMATAIGQNLPLADTIAGFSALTWGYCVLLVVILSLVLIFPAKHTLKVLASSYFAFVLLVIAGYLGDSPILIYLSPLGYFDSVGVFMGQINLLTDFLPKAIIGTLLAIVMYIYALNRRQNRQDYQV